MPTKKTNKVDLDKIFSWIKKYSEYDISIFENEENIEEVSIKNNKIDSTNVSEKKEYTITIYSKRGKGFLRSTYINKEIIEKSIKIAKVNNNLKYHYGLPSEEYPIKHFSDKKIEDLNIEDLHRLAKEIIKKSKYSISESSFSKEIIKKSIVNNYGLMKEETKTFFGYDINYNYKGVNWSDYNSFSYFPKSLFERIKKNYPIIKRYSKKREKKKAESIVFSIKTFHELLSNAFLENFNYDYIEKNQSFLDFKKKFIFDKRFDIIDEGVSKKGLLSSNFDHEGVKKGKHYLIKDGKVKSFLFNYDSAKKYGFKPFGNSYGSSVSTNNVEIKAKNKYEPKQYILIEEITGAHTANSITTEFSILANKATYFDGNNEIALKPFMINSSVIQLFNNLLGEFGKEESDLNIKMKKLVFSNVKPIF